jgi:O-antigen ligase
MGAISVAQQIFGMTDHSFYGFGQFDDAIVDGQGRVAHRLAGPIGETNRFAQIMAVLIPIGSGIAITSTGKQRWLAWSAVFLITAGMAFSFSRGAIVALALAIPFALAYRIVRLRQLVLIGLAGLVLLAAMPHYADRVASIGQLVVRTIGGLDPAGMRNADGAARGRLNEMKVAGMVFLEHPLLGVGPGLAPHHYEDYAAVVGGKVRPGTRRSHNLYLQLAAETGLIGVSAFGLVIFLTMRSLDRARHRLEATDRSMWGLVCGIELAMIILLMTSFFLHAAYIRYFWFVIGLAAAASVQSGVPALAAFLSQALRDAAERIRADEAHT